MKIIFSCVLFGLLFVIAASQQARVFEDEELVYQSVPEKSEVSLYQTEDRDKRGIWSVLIYGTSILLKTTTLGLTLSNAITGGCATYPSICTDKNAIERLDSEIKHLKSQYETLYIQNKKEYIEFREANTRNNYIEYYMNETIQAVENLTETQQLLFDKLEVQMPALFKAWIASKNQTSDQYIKSLLGTLELTLSEINDMIKEKRKETIVGIVTQFLVESAIGAFIGAYTKSYNQVTHLHNEDIFESAIWSAMFTADPEDAAIFLDPNHPRHDEIARKLGVPEAASVSLKTKFKRSGLAFKNMFSNAKQYFQGLRTGLQKWTRIRTWKGFKGKLLHSLQGPINKLKSIKSFITDPKVRKYQIGKFRLGWSEKIMTTIGIIGDAITLAVDQVQWAQVRDQMRKARKDYEEYKANLTDALTEIRHEQKYMNDNWGNVIHAFIDLVTPFKGFIHDATSHSNLYTALEGTRLTFDTHDPLFSTDLVHVARNNLAQKQNVIVNYMHDNNNNVKVLKDQLHAREILYDNTLKMTKSKDTVSNVLHMLKNIYGYSGSSTVRNFGTHLIKSEVVCIISALWPMSHTYDFYPLDKFRPCSGVTVSVFSHLDAQAMQQRKSSIMHSTVDHKLKSTPSVTLSALLDLVKNAYRNQHDHALQTFGNSITEKDILCYIATTHTRMATFDLYDLAPFRPHCSAVTNAKFNLLKQHAAKRRALLSAVRAALNVCQQYHVCVCVSEIATQNHATQADVMAILRQEWKQTKYCGSHGCACVNLH